MLKIFSEVGIFSGIKVTEWIVYGVLLTASFSLMIVSFAQTEAFYGTEYAFDIIYTSDSPSLVKGNVYLALTHAENDLRQPLFAVFAAPFIGIPYLFGRLFVTTASVQAMLVNSVQVIMLFVANSILAKMMKLSPMKRICFILLTCCTYTHLLFTLICGNQAKWLCFCLWQTRNGIGCLRLQTITRRTVTVLCSRIRWLLTAKKYQQLLTNSYQCI